MSAAAQKLTKTTVDAAQATGKDYWLWDSEIRRFGLRVRASGAKSYAVQYRNSYGTTKRLTIGQPGEVWTPDAARKRARELLAQVDSGDDPAGDLQQKRDGMTLRELVSLYLEQYATAHLRPSTQKDLGRYLERFILPELGAKKLPEIETSQVARLHAKLRGTPTQANRVLAYLSGIFSFAIGQKLSSENPCQGIKKFQEEKRERYASDDELKALTQAINDYPDQRAADAFRLLILTGARLSEVVKATWDMFDLQKGTWIKPSAHTKQKKIHAVPLSGAAVSILAAMRDASDPEDPFLFPGRKAKPEDPPKARADLNRPWQAIKKASGITDFRKHDLRHSYASQLVGAGVPLFDVGKLLGHTQIATTMRYAHLADDPLRAATNKMGAIFGALEEKPAGGVVKLKRAKAG